MTQTLPSRPLRMKSPPGCGARRVASIPDIRPTSAVKDALADPKTIGRELRVRYIVRGLARRESEDLRINVELIEAESVRQVWVGTFDYRPGLAGAQTRTAAFIGRTLAAELLRAEVRRPLPARPGAGHYTMLGRALMTERISAERNARAIAYFEKAMSVEPSHFLSLVHFARATAGYSLTGWLPEGEHEERLAKAEHAILRALQQEPKSAHAHAAHGQVLRAKGEYPQAIEAFKLALLHNPDFVHARAELGRTLIDIGKPEQAIAEIERAIKISPTDISLYTWYYWAGLAALHLSRPRRRARLVAEVASGEPVPRQHAAPHGGRACRCRPGTRGSQDDRRVSEGQAGRHAG